MAGGNLIYESSGMTASLLGASFEAFLIDDEMHSAIYRTLRGVEVSDETIGLEAISEAVLGEGHFLGHGQTMSAMERDYVYPALADRDPPISWSEGGRETIWQRANQQVRTILSSEDPGYLDTKHDKAIRDKFNILL